MKTFRLRLAAVGTAMLLAAGLVYAQTLGSSQAQTLPSVNLTALTNQVVSGTSPNLTTVNWPASAGAVTLTMPITTDTLVGRATTDTLTNKTVTAPVFSGSVTGTYTLAGTPTVTSPTITGATLTTSTYNGNTWTAGTGTLTIAAAKTLTASNTLTLAGTDTTTMTFPTTSATIARTDAANAFTGVQTITALTASGILYNATAPTVSGSFCTSPSVPASNGNAVFTINVGSACSVSAGTITFPTATTGWVVECHDVTTPASNYIEQSSGTTTTAVMTNYTRTTGLAANFTSSDVLRCKAFAY